MSTWLLENLLVVGLLAAAVSLLCRLGRFRPAVCHALWVLLLVKLLTPPVATRGMPPEPVADALHFLTSPLLEQDREEAPGNDRS